MDKAVRWISVFLHSGGNPQTEADFPKFDFWCPDRDSSKAQGERGLRELRERGDGRDWMAAGFPDPFKYKELRSTTGWFLDPLERL